MKFSCEICKNDFVEDDEETIWFLKTGAPHICDPCYRIQMRKLFDRSAEVIQEIRAELGPR